MKLQMMYSQRAIGENLETCGEQMRSNYIVLNRCTMKRLFEVEKRLAVVWIMTISLRVFSRVSTSLSGFTWLSVD